VADDRLDVEWKWVRGHAGHPQNEYAHHLATRAAKQQTDSGGLTDSGFEPWLEKQRERGRYLDFHEFAPPAPPPPPQRRPGPG
jgi:ribonuclease HI